MIIHDKDNNDKYLCFLNKGIVYSSGIYHVLYDIKLFLKLMMMIQNASELRHKEGFVTTFLPLKPGL